MASVVSKIADVLRVLSPTKGKKRFTSAIVLAAGDGNRFGRENGRKQFCPVAGVPALVRSLQVFQTSEQIREIILVTAKDEIERCESYREEYGLTKIKVVLPGGSDRQASAKIGFDAVSSKAEFVAIHDGARCLLTEKMLRETLEAAFTHGAAVAAEKSRDSVKVADAAGFVKESPDRQYVWLAKTPQIFLANMYRAALYTAEKDNVRATDDSALVERIGFRVKLVECGSENLKLTVPSDLPVAEAILRSREE